jgi:hypothetical protein
MRTAVVGLLLGLGLLLALVGTTVRPQDAFGQFERGAPAKGNGDLVALAVSGDGGNLVAVLDPQQRSLCVYEINRTSGAISLKSVRQLAWDLTLEEFNTTSPSPRDIRGLVERR